MPTTLNFKDVLDLPEWQPLTPALGATAAGTGIAYDMRNDYKVCDPYIFMMRALTGFERYNRFNDAWLEMTAFTAVGGAIGAGSHCVFVPSHGCSGTIGGTPTTTSFTLATLPNSASALINQFVNRGAGLVTDTSVARGFKIRVIGSGTGSSGKVEERFIISNTAGTTPVVTLDTALTFTPLTTDRYELLAGRIYILGSGTTAAGFWKAMDRATKTISGNLSVTNLAATIGTDTASHVFDEQYVPYNRRPGEGYLGTSTYDASNPDTALKCLTATAATGTTLTGTVAGGDSTVAANEYRNFQIRIVEDTTNVTAVGQRRKIVSHTAGASPVYTVAAWTVTPSATAKFVIENNNDLILFTNAATVTYSYAAGGFAADASWSTAAAAGGAIQYANPPAGMGAGCCVEQAFGIDPLTAKIIKPSYVYWLRGAGSTTMAYLDIAAGTNGVWTTIASLGQSTVTINTGACSAYDPVGSEGRYFYVALNATGRFVRFDMLTSTWEPWVSKLAVTEGAAVAGSKLAFGLSADPDVKFGFMYHMANTSTLWFRSLCQR